MSRGSIVLVTIFGLLPVIAIGGGPAEKSKVIVDKSKREIRFPATVHPSAMKRPFGVKGHHAIVWKKGKSAGWALFKAEPSDHDVRVALEQLGAKAGENLSMETWTERENEKSREPDKRVEGSRIEVFVEWKGSGGRIPLHELVTAPHSNDRKLDFRYGGHERLQKEFHSGCIVCLYSCPGGAVSNHNKTIRDYVNEGVIFDSNRKRLPKSGTAVTIILRVS